MTDARPAGGSDRREISGYVEEVMSRLPHAAPGLHRVRADLESHLHEAAEASGSVAEAVADMGPAEEAAAGYAGGLDLTPASLADRAGAFLVDAGLGAALSAAVFATGLDLSTGSGMALGIVLATVFGALSLLYFPVLEERYGQTLGKRLFGLCVVRENGLRPELWRTVVRRLPLFFEIFWLDALFAPFTEKRQRAFDIVADTVVVRGVAWGGRPAGWTLALVLWGLPLAAFFHVAGPDLPLPF